MDLFDQVCIEIIAVAADDHSDFPIDASQVFFAKTRKYATMLSKIDFMTKCTQNGGHSFNEFLDALDSLPDSCEANKSNPESKLFGC